MSSCVMSSPLLLLYLFTSSIIVALLIFSSEAGVELGLGSTTDFPRLPVKAIYQFGDSISDTGNLIRADPSAKCGNWPYGQTFFNFPTGRYSDGLIIIDFFAKFLDLPLIDAYLNKDGKFEHGVNFAVGGATALNVSVLKDKYNVSSPTKLSLPVQLSWFKSHLQSFYPRASERKRELAKGLFIMGEIGGNDYNYAFFQGRTLSEAYKMVPDVIQEIRNAIEEIIDVGATQVFVPGNLPIGCLLKYLSVFKTNDLDKYDELKCLEEYNRHSMFHNEKLQGAIVELQGGYPNVSIVYMDYYGALTEIIRHPNLYGFDAATIQEACCGVDDYEYKFNKNAVCGVDGVTVCDNPEEHVSWDGIHLTQHAYHVMAKQLMPPIYKTLKYVNKR